MLEIFDNLFSLKGIFLLDAVSCTGKKIVDQAIAIKSKVEKYWRPCYGFGIVASHLTGDITVDSTFKMPLYFINIEIHLINHVYLYSYWTMKVYYVAWMNCVPECSFSGNWPNITVHRNSIQIMGGITLLMAGDLWENFLMIPLGLKADEVNARIKSFHLSSKGRARPKH